MAHPEQPVTANCSAKPHCRVHDQSFEDDDDGDHGYDDHSSLHGWQNAPDGVVLERHDDVPVAS